MTADDTRARAIDAVVATGYVFREYAAAVVDAVEPIIRADERAKAYVHSTGTSSPDACCQCCYDVNSIEAVVRERIAQEIETACRQIDRFGAPVICNECQRAARIAQGTQ